MHVTATETLNRLWMIRNILQWEGRISRRRVQELFGLSGTRASEWIREFRQHYPSWTSWDSRHKLYHATGLAFAQGTVKTPDEARSLTQYLALVGIPDAHPAIGAMESSSQLQRCVVWAAFPDLTPPIPQIFSVLSEACSTQRAVRISYRSMREPVPQQREISPHSLVRAGRRWHVRAFCMVRGTFRDFALGRIGQASLLDSACARPQSADETWNAKVNVRLVAHPHLNHDQARLIQFEYFHDTSARTDTHRAALVPYFVQDIRAATDTSKQRPPEYQLAVANIEEIRRWLMPT
jgi:predicted DNA-binding transcriptional regulator YafY